MENRNQSETIIYSVEGCKLLMVPNKGNVETYSEKAILKIIQVGDDKLVIRVNDFEYQLFQETPIYLTAYETYRSYILPSLEGNYAVLINNDIADHQNVYACLDLILENACNLIYNQGNKEQNIQSLRKSQILLQQNLQTAMSGETPVGDYYTPDGQTQTPSRQMETPSGEEVQQINFHIVQNQKLIARQEQDKQEEQKVDVSYKPEPEQKKDESKVQNMIAKYISKGGSYISQGILIGADVLHKGIQDTGKFIEKHVTNKQNVKISESTKGKVKFVKNVSGKIFEFTSYAATTIIDTTVKIGSYAVGALLGNKGEQSQNKSFQYLREVASASVQATGEIYLSLDSAADKIGKEIGETTTIVVKKKFGDDAAEVVSDSFKVALDANNVYKDIKSLGVKKVMKKTAKTAIKENI